MTSSAAALSAIAPRDELVTVGGKRAATRGALLLLKQLRGKLPGDVINMTVGSRFVECSEKW